MISTPTPWPTLDLSQLPEELPQGMKGYELYSWQTGDTWNFTLISGTNRNKNFEELMSPINEVTETGLVKITVTGVDQIKKILDRLPANTEIIWGGIFYDVQVSEGTLFFSHPPKAIIDELIDYCEEQSIHLNDPAELE